MISGKIARKEREVSPAFKRREVLGKGKEKGKMTPQIVKLWRLRAGVAFQDEMNHRSLGASNHALIHSP